MTCHLCFGTPLKPCSFQIFPQYNTFVEAVQADTVKPSKLNTAFLALVNAGLPMKDFFCSFNIG